MEKEHGILTNQDKKEKQLAWRMKKLTEQWQQASICYQYALQSFKTAVSTRCGPGCFDGNPLEYHNFMTLFHELVQKWIDDPRGRLTRLIWYTKGDPKDMIQHCVQQPSSVAYENSKKILDQKYGNPYNIVGVYRKEIKSWPQIRNGDGKSYQKFYNFLVRTSPREENGIH